MQWLDATGRTNLLQFAGAFEAVTDSKGDNIVYAETEVGMLHWMSEASLNGGIDEILNLIGSAPALSSNGQSLVYLAEDQTLHLYQRSTRATTQLGSDAYSEFTLAGNQYIFGVTAGGRLDRIDLVSGTVEQWLQPSLAIDPTSITPGVSRTISTFYYGPPSVYLEVGPGEIVNFSGSHFDAPGWRVRLVDRDLDWHVEASNFAWIQIPSDMSPGGTSLQWIAPDQPLLNYRIQVTIGSGLYYCNAPYHQDLSGFVTPNNPAAIGEVIHYYLSGLAGVEFVADGTPNPIDHPVLLVNPPSLSDPASSEVEFLGLAPGQIGPQQMDLRIKQPSNISALFVNGPASCKAPPTGI